MIAFLAKYLFGGSTMVSWIVVVGLGVSLGLGALRWQYYAGYSDGKQAERTAALEHAMGLIKERSEINAEIGAMDDAELCAELGGKWVRDTARCE